jgi:hypothetical protein
MLIDLDGEVAQIFSNVIYILKVFLKLGRKRYISA